MPTVESYGGQRVTQQPLPAARRTAVPSPDVFGAGLGEVAQRIGAQGYGAIVQDERDKADQLAVLNAENQLGAWENKRLYDPQTGALTQKGKDSFGLPEQVGQEFTDVSNNIAGTLNTDRQRIAFQRSSSSRAQSIDLTLRRHVFGEMQQYDQSETQAAVKLSESNAIANANDPRRISAELTRATAAIRDYAARNGIGPDQTAEQVQAATTDIHTGVIEHLLAVGQDHAAQAYFDETKDQISGEKIAAIERALEEGNLRGESQRKADELIAEGRSMTETLEQVRGIDDPKLRDQVQERVEHAFAIKKQAERDDTEQTMIGAANLIDKTGTVRSVPPAVWTGLSISERTALEQYAKRKQTGTGDETDLVTYYGLMQQASTAPEKFAAANLLMYLPKLGKTEFKQLTELQNSIRKGDKPKADEMLDGFLSIKDVAENSLDAAGIARTGADADKKVVAQFIGQINDQVAALERSTGKKASHEDVQAISDRIVKNVVIERGSWWNILPGGKSFTDIKKPIRDLHLADIPQADRQLIENKLRGASIPVTDATVLEYYLRWKQRLGEIE